MPEYICVCENIFITKPHRKYILCPPIIFIHYKTPLKICSMSTCNLYSLRPQMPITLFILVRFQYFTENFESRKMKVRKERKWQCCNWSVVELVDARRRLCKSSLKEKRRNVWTNKSLACLPQFYSFILSIPGNLTCWYNSYYDIVLES